ncbi:MAG: hypothetical protein A3I75_05330 [Deltaproteobacteria bacterium RIFCSPLOWO2_02_FULL_50_16]|nr:MAG: hypothetical protein A2053_00060 [Deltaproteobacteria bacterium GWA2_50_8]OGQ57964.1 MAG: hypothetical protein A3I75_05330 [Deltaproteobacteria bacterium RIFCSPLOWO2_02_FULL_50_16]OGQ66340.1 MAG: hypothetical protein A3F89_01835 [Deltaproteobacteria bacterium RIFCSPLOWO2_12_FULL_50_11]
MATGAIMILFGLPGTWVLWIAVALYSFIADFNTTDWHVVILTFIMTLIGEVVEFMVGVLGSKQLEVSNGAIVASIIGGIIGAVTGFPIFLIGSILGMLAGVFLGAFIWEWVSSREVLLSLRKAMAATFSRIVSIFAKFSIALIIIVYVSLKIF